MVFWALTGGGPRRPGHCLHKPPRGELTPAFSPPLCLLAQRPPTGRYTKTILLSHLKKALLSAGRPVKHGHSTFTSAPPSNTS